MEFSKNGKNLLEKINKEIKENGKLTPAFIDEIINNSKKEFAKIGDSTRVCVVTLDSGHTLVGYSRVLDPEKDNEEIGNKVAFENAKEKAWDTLGAIAKLFLG